MMQNSRLAGTRRSAFIGALGLLFAGPIAAAQKNADADANDRVLYSTSSAEPATRAAPNRIPNRDKRLIREYFSEHPVRTVGHLALPPNWREIARPGKRLTVALSAHAQPLPADLSLALGSAEQGLSYVRIEQTILRIAASDQRVLDRFEL